MSYFGIFYQLNEHIYSNISKINFEINFKHFDAYDGLERFQLTI